jgi:membrane protein YqaA with SNARE-associated domain
MINEKLHQIIRQYVKLLQRFADRFWFPPLLALLAALDNFVIVIPNEGILISSSIVIPKRWFIFALSVTIGSSIGALLLVALVRFQGLHWILEFYPGIDKTHVWEWTLKFFESYGLLLVFVVGITPLAQQPAIILASLTDSPLWKLAVVIFFGRSIKYCTMAYVATHAPRLLPKIWGVQGELKDVGVEIKKD